METEKASEWGRSTRIFNPVMTSSVGPVPRVVETTGSQSVRTREIHEHVRIWKRQISIFVKSGKCQNLNLSESENVRFQFLSNPENVRIWTCQNLKMSESFKTGKCRNQKMSDSFETVRCQNIDASEPGSVWILGSSKSVKIWWFMIFLELDGVRSYDTCQLGQIQILTFSDLETFKIRSK